MAPPAPPAKRPRCRPCAVHKLAGRNPPGADLCRGPLGLHARAARGEGLRRRPRHHGRDRARGRGGLWRGAGPDGLLLDPAAAPVARKPVVAEPAQHPAGPEPEEIPPPERGNRRPRRRGRGCGRADAARHGRGGLPRHHADPARGSDDAASGIAGPARGGARRDGLRRARQCPAQGGAGSGLSGAQPLPGSRTNGWPAPRPCSSARHGSRPGGDGDGTDEDDDRNEDGEET